MYNTYRLELGKPYSNYLTNRMFEAVCCGAIVTLRAIVTVNGQVYMDNDVGQFTPRCLDQLGS